MPRRQSTVEAMTRVVDSGDFERLLRSPIRARTSHFAVHHVPSAGGAVVAASSTPVRAELSTIVAPVSERPVDDLPAAVALKGLGAIVPKRHARRAVTRSLLKRQIHAAGGRHAAGLPTGLWMVRLRAPFDRQAFPSAASEALRLAARAELDALFARAAQS